MSVESKSDQRDDFWRIQRCNAHVKAARDETGKIIGASVTLMIPLEDFEGLPWPLQNSAVRAIHAAAAEPKDG